MPFLRNCKRNPFARLLLFYMAGIASAPFLLGLGGWIWFPLALTGLTGILFFPAFLNRNFQTGWKSGLCAFLLLYSVGVYSFSSNTHVIEKAAILPADRIVYRLRILSIPEKCDGNTRAVARILSTQSRCDSLISIKIRLYFTAANRHVPVPGEEILAHISLNSIAPPGNPNEFNFAGYLATRHIYGQAYAGPGDWKTCGVVSNTLPALSCRFRNALMRCYQKAPMDPGSRALLTALTLGYREDVDTATEAAFSRAGVMHIMALSGFNVGMIASVILFLAGGFRKKTPGVTAIIFTLLVVWSFVLVTGMSPSVTRAAVMISLGLTGLVTRQHVNTANVLFASAFLMLAVSPRMLFDAGFQLSFAAVGGILMSEALHLRSVFLRLPLIARVWQLFILSCAAQLATLPFTLYYFHQFPLYFWLTNLYVVPLVSVIICIGMLLLILCWWNVAVAALGKGLGLLLKWLVVSVSLPEHLPGSLISRIFITPGQAFFLAVVVVFLIAWFAERKLVLLQISLSGLLIFQSMGIFRHMRNERQKFFMVASVRHTTALLFVNGRNSALFLDPGKPADDKSISYALDGFLLSRGLRLTFFAADSSISMPSGGPCPGLYFREESKGGNIQIGFNHKKILLLRDNGVKKYSVDSALQVDCLIISNGMKLPPDRILQDIQPSLVILDSSMPVRQQKKWISALAKKGIHCHCVSGQGYFLDE
jgi:competence protein ComEC